MIHSRIPVMDRDSTAWWDALRRHEFLVQRCSACGRLRWPARSLCGDCWSQDWSWTPTCGIGEVVSWMVNHHNFGEAFPSPYVVVIARLAEQEDLLVPGTLLGAQDGARLSIGAPLELVPVDLDEGVTLVQWAIPGSAGTAQFPTA